MGTARDDYVTAEKRLGRYHTARVLVKKQAQDDALWCLTDQIEIAYLQQELRRLHAVLEGDIVAEQIYEKE